MSASPEAPRVHSDPRGVSQWNAACRWSPNGVQRDASNVLMWRTKQSAEQEYVLLNEERVNSAAVLSLLITADAFDIDQ